jgi:hypothetical protein
MTCSTKDEPCAGSDTADHREYTRFRLDLNYQRWRILGQEDYDRATRREFAALAKPEREAELNRWRWRIQECLSLDYWTLLDEAVRSYRGLRDVHESATVREAGKANKEVIPRELPKTLPAGTRMLFGAYHGRGLPSAAELRDCVVPVGMSYETTTQRRYVYALEDGWPASDPPEYVDWRAMPLIPERP